MIGSPSAEPGNVVGVGSGVTMSIHRAALPALLALAMSGCVATVPVPTGPAVVGGTYGYDTLPPDYYGYLHGYGTWRVVPGYGTVWCPSVASAWTPYYYGPPAPWSFTFYFGDWVGTPYGWGWVPGHRHHPHWQHWAYGGRRHRHGHGGGDHHGGYGDGGRHGGGHGRADRPRYETPTAPRGAFSPSEGRHPAPATVRRVPNVRPAPNATPQPRPDGPDSRGDPPRGPAVRPLPPTVRSPGVPIADRPQPTPPGGGAVGDPGIRIDTPRAAFSPSSAPRPSTPPSFGRSRPSPGFTGGGRGSGSSVRGVPRGRW